MKRLFYFALGSSLIFVACGDDGSNNPFVPSEGTSSSFAGIFSSLSSSTPIEDLSSSCHMDLVSSSGFPKGKLSSSVVKSCSSFRMSSASLSSSSSYVNPINSSSVRSRPLWNICFNIIA